MSDSKPLDDRQAAPAEGGLSPAPDGSLRLTSLDALRGFDMFWIAGGSYVVGALNKLSDNPVFAFLKSQLSHVDWDGFRFYDLIFPLFVFMTGVSLTFSLTKAIGRDGVVVIAVGGSNAVAPLLATAETHLGHETGDAFASVKAAPGAKGNPDTWSAIGLTTLGVDGGDFDGESLVLEGARSGCRLSTFPVVVSTG